jgi:LPS export ABC transporter protein LptC
MKCCILRSRPVIRIPLIILLAVTIYSCENKIDFIPKSDLLSLPSLTEQGFETVYADSGKIQLILKAPLVEEYTNNQSPYYEFRSGIRVIFYDGHPDPVGTVTARYAKYTENDFLWELRDSVVVINEDNDKLETELLYWDQQKNLIYSDRFVKITNEDEIVMGTGFESDPKLNRRKIKKVNATIYLKDEE